VSGWTSVDSAVRTSVMHRSSTAPVALLAATLMACASAQATWPAAHVTSATTVDARGAPDVRLFLIGDAGGDVRNPVLQGLRTQVAVDPSRSMVLFLGDNVYPHGLPDGASASRGEAESRLGAQMDAVRAADARGVFIAGNHDWGSDGENGMMAVAREATFVNQHGGGRIRMLPEAGCPGPEVLDVGMALRLVLLDTEWLLRRRNQRATMSGCLTDERALLDSLAYAISSAGERKVVVAGHHPLQSGGPHGGNFGWQQHLFPLRDFWSAAWVPLPLAGSLYPLVRRLGRTKEDLKSKPYTRLRALLDSVMRVHRPLVYAAGHEHNLQAHQPTTSPLLLVSGAGSSDRASFVRALAATRFTARAHGFMRLDVWSTRPSQLTVFTVDRRGTATVRYQLAVE